MFAFFLCTFWYCITGQTQQPRSKPWSPNPCGNSWWYQSQTGYLLGRSCSTAHWKKHGTNDGSKLPLSPKILYRLLQMTGTPTYPIYGTHNDPVCSRAFLMFMLFNYSIIPVGCQAPTLNNRAQIPTERYSTVRTGTERCKMLVTTQWQAPLADHGIHFLHHAGSTYPKPSGIQQHYVVGSLLSRILCLFRSGKFTAPATTFDPTWHLSLQDILVDSHARRGVSLFVGHTNNCHCPVTAILAYLAVRGTSPGPLF